MSQLYNSKTSELRQVDDCVCNVCGIHNVVSRCSECNFHFCPTHCHYIHTCGVIHEQIVETNKPRYIIDQHQLDGIGVVFVCNHDDVTVDYLTPGGPADRSGALMEGDKVLRVDGVPVSELHDLSDAVLGFPGTLVSLTILRDGEVSEVKLRRDDKGAPHKLEGLSVHELLPNHPTKTNVVEVEFNYDNHYVELSHLGHKNHTPHPSLHSCLA
mmetsp:Transcript_18341/g.43136  ORF Transcript_18341/g.43136 Transcript_18341/m.43136 type:complete len:213 (-) Transcript_18341:39-677(-)